MTLFRNRDEWSKNQRVIVASLLVKGYDIGDYGVGVLVGNRAAVIRGHFGSKTFRLRRTLAGWKIVDGIWPLGSTITPEQLKPMLPA